MIIFIGKVKCTKSKSLVFPKLPFSKSENENSRTMSTEIIMNAVNVVKTLFDEYATHPNGELEAKLGRIVNDNGRTRFVSGVSKQDFQTLHDMLSTYSKWENRTPIDWVPSYDYHLRDNVRCTKSHEGVQFIRKTTVRHITLECPERSYDIRESLKDETPTEVKNPGLPNLVRVKKRKSFLYKIWTFDLTMVWSGTTEQEAQQMEPTFEVEIECRNQRDACRDSQYSAASLLEKMIDFLGRDTPYHLEVCPNN